MINPCTCDDEATHVAVDMGHQNGAILTMCVGCYDAMVADLDADGR